MTAIDENVMKYLALQELSKDYVRDNIERDPIVKEIRRRIADLTQQDPNVLSRVKSLENKQYSERNSNLISQNNTSLRI